MDKAMIAEHLTKGGQIIAAVAQADLLATIVALPDADLARRLAGTAADREALRNGLRTRRQSVAVGRIRTASPARSCLSSSCR
jgi:hypothetical protein